MRRLHLRRTAFIGMLIFACAIPLNAQDPEKFTDEQMRDFLLHAKVIASKQSGKGVTRPFRLTLSDGTITHDGSFQSVNQAKTSMQFDNGKTELNFRDSYKYNIAAFELAKMLGLRDMMPMTVERKWEGKAGSLTWWLPAKMDEGRMRDKHIEPPDSEAWSKQWHKMMVFAQLVYDTDRNGGNVLISADWHLWMIDFTRAFRLYYALENPKILTRCDRQLFQKLCQLEAAALERSMKNSLSKLEIKGVISRRDRIVALFKDLIAKNGEASVLYD
jgi:hypothetical protein